MHERAAQEAANQQKAFDQYVRQTAGSSGNTADQLSKLAELCRPYSKATGIEKSPSRSDSHNVHGVES